MSPTHLPGITCLLFLLCTIMLPGSAHSQVSMVQAFPNLSFNTPVDIQHAGDGTNRIFIVERAGVIKVFPNNPSIGSADVFLDISDSVRSGGELGLLGLAFHPDYASNGYFYLNFTRGALQTGNLRSVIARFQVSPSNPDSAMRSSQLTLLEILQPYENHNGGQLAFGPDGYLYCALGDGGSGGDPQNNGQKLTTLLGKLLRINVDSTQGSLHYAIPGTNPFAGNSSGYREEIYAYGLRNPWRFSFDHSTNRLWCADVGQNLWEEIDTVVNGGNYGWRIMEGMNCYNPSVGCNTSGLRLPVYTYAHDSGCSITGGYVYRGSKAPSLYGRYVYTDFCQGEIFALDISGGGPAVNDFILSSGQNISSFGTDESNELYMCSMYSGIIYTFEEEGAPPPAPALREPADGSTGHPDTTMLKWDPTGPGTTAHVLVASDILFGHLLVNDSLITDSVYNFVAPETTSTFYWKVRVKNANGFGPFSSSWSFSTGSIVSSALHVRRLWNMLSLPLRVIDSTTTAVFPTATSAAFAYSPLSGYASSDQLVPGRGYWLKFPADETLMVYGSVISADSIEVDAGWNIIGGISGVVDISSIVQDPPGNVLSPYYSYDGAYSSSTQLLPGRAYWVKVQNTGRLILTSP